MVQTVEVPGGRRLTDQISLGVLASTLDRDAVDEAVAATGRGAKRSDGKLPPHVVVYFTVAMALFADDDYEEVAARLSDTLAAWGCWDDGWSVPTSGGITQARQRLGYEPLAELFATVAVPAADELTRGAFLGGRRLMAIDGFEWDVPDTAVNVAAFGYPGSAEGQAAFPKVRVVSICELGTHAMVDAEIGPIRGKGAGEQTLARRLYERLDDGWLVIADRNFYNYADWRTAAASGAQLLWRIKADLTLPVAEFHADGSYRSALINPKVRGKARARLIERFRSGEHVDPDEAVPVRVIEYEVPDRDGDGKGELIALITTIGDPDDAPAAVLAEAYHQRWDHEGGNDEIKTQLRGPGRILRSKSPDMIRAEIYGYLLCHHAISSLIAHAAAEADIDPDRVKFKRTVRIVRRRVADPAAFSP